MSPRGEMRGGVIGLDDQGSAHAGRPHACVIIDRSTKVIRYLSQTNDTTFQNIIVGENSCFPCAGADLVQQ